jgi:hypothetical protein
MFINTIKSVKSKIIFIKLYLINCIRNFVRKPFYLIHAFITLYKLDIYNNDTANWKDVEYYIDYIGTKNLNISYYSIQYLYDSLASFIVNYLFYHDRKLGKYYFFKLNYLKTIYNYRINKLITNYNNVINSKNLITLEQIKEFIFIDINEIKFAWMCAITKSILYK